jgi:amino acid transporter
VAEAAAAGRGLAAEASHEGAHTLKAGAIGLLSSTVIGVASTAPAYSLAATVGLVTAAAFVQAPLVMALAFIPMLFVAISFYYLNRVDPDCGTTFSWVTRAMGPHLGWINGWVIVAADVVVMSNLAQIAGNYSLSLVGADPTIHAHWSTFIGVLWILLMTAIVTIGIEASARTQWVLLLFEYTILMAFVVIALWDVYTGSPAHSVHPSLSWFDPTAGSAHGLAEGILLAVFLYWGWDSAVNVNEETENPSHTPGVAAVLSTFFLLFIYVAVTFAAVAYAGPAALTNHYNDILGFLGHDVFGSGWEKLMVLAVLTSAAASTQTTILPTARVTFSMSRAGAAPRWMGSVHPRWRTPWLSSLAMGLVSAALFIVLTSVSSAGNILADSIAALGLLIAFYYGFTGIASAVFYRRMFTRGWKYLWFAGILPVLGGLMLFALFVYNVLQLNKVNANANFSSAQVWFGFGSADVLGVGLILVGIPLVILAHIAYPRFFRRRLEVVDQAMLDHPITPGDEQATTL